MRKQSVEAIIRTLNDASVRYLIAGGLAVVAHGYLRFTADVDLIIDLEEANARRALSALSRLGYRPRAPVALDAFADPKTREQWAREKGLLVFSLRSAEHPATEVDLFVESPVEFDAAYRAALKLEIGPDAPATFLSYDDLLRLKQASGRPQDLADIDGLRARKDADRE